MRKIQRLSLHKLRSAQKARPCLKVQSPSYALRIRQKLDAVEAGVTGSVLVKENLGRTAGRIRAARNPLAQIGRALNHVAQADSCRVVELETCRGELLWGTEHDRRW